MKAHARQKMYQVAMKVASGPFADKVVQIATGK